MTTKADELWYWRWQCESANRRMRVYPKNDERWSKIREMYEKQYIAAKEKVDELLGVKS